MDPSNPGPGVQTAPPAAPAAPAAPAEPQTPPPAQPSQPNGSEPVTNPGGTPEQTVPFDRFQEVNDAKKAAEEEAQRLRDELAQRSNSQPQLPQNDDDDLDPDVEELIRKGAKKLGLVSQAELDAQRMQSQVQQDVRDLESSTANSGVPYVHADVLKYAETNNIPLTSKAALEAAYKQMNWDKLIEVERQRAIQGANNPPASGAERPGGGGTPSPSEEPDVQGRNPKERGISRIRAARQKIAQ